MSSFQWVFTEMKTIYQQVPTSVIHVMFCMPPFSLTEMPQCLAPHSSLQVQRQHPDSLQTVLKSLQATYSLNYSLLPLP